MADEATRIGTDAAGRAIVDDIVLPFRTVRSNVRGRIVRLGATADQILKRHDYPVPVSEAVGQALALVAMLGSNMKNTGAILTVQARTDGPISLLVADYKVPGALRGCATFDLGELTAGDRKGKSAMFGNGHLALTMDPGEGRERYQGIVALENQTLSEAAHTYFRQSEQLPTFLRLAVARTYGPGDGERGWSWRVGGILLQHLTREGGKADAPGGGDADEMILDGEDDDVWQRVRLLAETVEDHELVDPTLSAETILYRLFHEEGVITYDAQGVRDECRCSRDRVAGIIATLPSDERQSLVDDSGKIAVKCDFCSATYWFDP